MGTGLSPAPIDPAPDQTNAQSICTARALRDAVGIFFGSGGAWCVHDLRKERLIETDFAVEYTNESIALGNAHRIWFVHDVQWLAF